MPFYKVDHRLRYNNIFLLDTQDLDLDKENDVKDWNVQRNSELAERNYYVSKVINVSPQKTIGVHRLMFPDITTHSSLYIDHINRVKQDNRLKNLRVVSPSENSMNKRGENLASKGVFYVKHAKKWRAQITYNKKRHSIGYFLTKEGAQIAYNKKALEISSCAFLPLDKLNNRQDN